MAVEGSGDPSWEDATCEEGTHGVRVTFCHHITLSADGWNTNRRGTWLSLAKSERCLLFRYKAHFVWISGSILSGDLKEWRLQ